MVAFSLDSISKWWYIILLVTILLVWQVINIIWLTPKLDLINQYSLLMKFLVELSCTNSKCAQIVLEAIKRPRFEQMQMNINMKFNELNNKINSPYRLLYPNTALIKNKFVELINDTKILYEEFTYIVKSENIPDNKYDSTVIENAYKKFVFELELSRTNYNEIKNSVPDTFLSIPSLPPHHIPYGY